MVVVAQSLHLNGHSRNWAIAMRRVFLKSHHGGLMQIYDYFKSRKMLIERNYSPSGPWVTWQTEKMLNLVKLHCHSRGGGLVSRNLIRGSIILANYCPEADAPISPTADWAELIQEGGDQDQLKRKHSPL